MSVEPSAFLKPLADEMASLLCDHAGAPAIALLQQLGQLLPEGSGTAAPADPPGAIGIWEPTAEGHERSPDRRHEWIYWAEVERIPPKGARKRVLLLGESVARGYFYDPELTPAQVLEASLTTLLEEPVEVIDLARIGIQSTELTRTAGAALALQPDALILFAGNNWVQIPRSAADGLDRHGAATALRELGVAGFKGFREKSLSARLDTDLRQYLEELSLRVPTVLIIPEFNLADWRLDAEAEAPWLPAGRNRCWLERRAAAGSALAAGRLDEAEALAREMIELDGGTAASGWTILADCARARGDLGSARTYLEKARDSQLWDTTPQIARTHSIIQEALRRCAIPGRVAVVDLPRLFTAWQSGELPGRHLFLDYCHMTAEGIRLAMATAASELAILLDSGRPRPDLASLVAAAPRPSARLEAEAHFGAAIHGAHWGQSEPLVRFLCHEAAGRSPETARAMREYLELQTRRAPAWTCAATDRLASLTTPALLRNLLSSTQMKLFDPVLLPAIAEALEKTGLPALARLDQLRQEERSLSEQPRDLLDPYHRASWTDRDWLGWPAHFCRAHTSASRFPWVSRSPREVVFEITCRRPPATPPAKPADPAECPLLVNGVPAGQLSLIAEWRTSRWSVPADLVKTGVNWLEIRWPIELPGGEEAIRRAALDLEQSRSLTLLPVFAEISSLRAVQP
jgi:hypothetical protein